MCVFECWMLIRKIFINTRLKHMEFIVCIFCQDWNRKMEILWINSYRYFPAGYLSTDRMSLQTWWIQTELWPHFFRSNLVESGKITVAQSICTRYSCFENLGWFVTLKKCPKYGLQKVGCKKKGHCYSMTLLFKVLDPKKDQADLLLLSSNSKKVADFFQF